MRLRNDNGPFNIFSEAKTNVEFYDLDPMQIVWHGNYINYFELGRRSLLEKIGYGYNEMKDSGYSFPIVEISVKYLKPLRYKDSICIRAILTEYENCLKIKYEIHNIKTEDVITRGLSTQMVMDIKTGESCFACPEVLIKKVEYLILENNRKKTGI